MPVQMQLLLSYVFFSCFASRQDQELQGDYQAECSVAVKEELSREDSEGPLIATALDRYRIQQSLVGDVEKMQNKATSKTEEQDAG